MVARPVTEIYKVELNLSFKEFNNLTSNNLFKCLLNL